MQKSRKKLMVAIQYSSDLIYRGNSIFFFNAAQYLEKCSFF